MVIRLLLIGLLVPGIAWAADDLVQRAQGLFKPIPEQPPALKGNAITPERLELGKMLYFDPRLSRSWLISCNTCHNVGTAGVDMVETSIGHGWQRGPRNSPTVLNAVFNIAQFWDGRAADLKEQAKGPIQAGVEMSNSPERVVATLQSMPGYVAAFEKAFPKEAEPVSFDNMAGAIEAFEATLLTPNAPFDKFLRGEQKALSAEEKRGLALFMDKGCAACHNGINVGGNGYYPFGVVEKPGAELLPPEDEGRFKVTQTATDKYVFRAPPLRNVVLTPPYFHTGQVWDLRQAVAIMGTTQLGSDLSDAEVDAIVTFFGTLTGSQPQVGYPLLPPITDKTPLPEYEVAAEAETGH